MFENILYQNKWNFRLQDKEPVERTIMWRLSPRCGKKGPGLGFIGNANDAGRRAEWNADKKKRKEKDRRILCNL